MEHDETAESSGLSRKDLLKRAGLLGAAATIPSVGGIMAPQAAEAAEQLGPLKAFTAAEAATLEAVVERLIPTDSTGPGAKEANVLRYIDGALAGERSMFRDAYASALAAIDAYSQLKFGAGFAALSVDNQDQVLGDMDSSKATGFTPSAKAVFEMIRGHTVEGMFGDPGHGGNTGFVGWKLVRFPGPRLIIDAHDQKLDVVPKAKLQSTYAIKLFKGSLKGGV